MRKVEVVPYDTNWPLMYAAEANLLSAIFGEELVRIHHIGSTSIPGLAAKSIIDMLAEVRDITKIDSLNSCMWAAGYKPKGEYGIPGRRYFFKGTEDMHSHHLHAFQTGNAEVARHLLFRDYLRSHPQEARQYASLKESLAANFPDNIEGYMDGKDAFIKEMDRQAAAWSLANSHHSARPEKQ